MLLINICENHTKIDLAQPLTALNPVDELKEHLIELQSDFWQTIVPSVDSNFHDITFCY